MELTRNEYNLKRLLQIWMGFFLAGAVMFLFFGRALFGTINHFSAFLFPSLPVISLEEQNFWLTLTTSLMVTLIFLTYLAQKDIRANFAFIAPILLSKFVSSGLFFV